MTKIDAIQNCEHFSNKYIILHDLKITYFFNKLKLRFELTYLQNGYASALNSWDSVLASWSV